MELFHRTVKSPPSDGERGQSLVEFAIGMLVIIIIMAGLLDLGRLYYIYTILEDAAGEGALYMAINPDCPDSAQKASCANPKNVVWRVRESSKTLVDLDDPLTTRITWAYPDDTTNPGRHEPGETVYVQIEHDFDLLTPFIQGIAGSDQLTITVEASQVIVKVPGN